MKNNSTIYKNPQEQHVFDLTGLGTIVTINSSMNVFQEKHFFQIGDVLYYNVKTKMFAKAVAVNNIESEACGVVSHVQDNNNFTMVGEGDVATDKYTFDEGTELYLSSSVPGRLASIAPVDVIKRIAIQTSNGIRVNIQRGYRTMESNSPEELESYTRDELDEVIKNIW